MELSSNAPSHGSSGPHSDVVMSCRVRLARNIAGFPFVNRASEAQRRELLNISRQVLLGAGIDDHMTWVDLNQATQQDRRLLVERHLISTQHAMATTPRAVVVSGDESLSIMVNEEDHLRMQIIASGLQLEALFARICAVDDMIERKVDYAFSPRWGYLTACPTNVGTGLRFSAMLHLPALKLTDEIERVRRAAKDLHLAVRGYYGEGSDSAGDLYQVSNQLTLGRSEQELLSDFGERILPRIIEYERQARRLLQERNPTLLEDRVHRALGILRGARLLGTEEAMRLLSRVRLGVLTGGLADISLRAVNDLYLRIQPTHLRVHVGDDLSADELRIARASLVRRALCQRNELE